MNVLSVGCLIIKVVHCNFVLDKNFYDNKIHHIFTCDRGDTFFFITWRGYPCCANEGLTNPIRPHQSFSHTVKDSDKTGEHTHAAVPMLEDTTYFLGVHLFPTADQIKIQLSPRDFLIGKQASDRNRLGSFVTYNKHIITCFSPNAFLEE